MTAQANGAALVGRILAYLAAKPPCNASDLAIALGAARTTTFEAIARLDAAGLIERDARGMLAPGPMAAMLAYAAFGLAPIAGTVEALLPALRDDTDARAEFAVEAEGAWVVLAHRSPAGSTPDKPGGAIVEARIASPAAAAVRLRLREGAAETEIAAARRSAQAVADALSRKLLSAENSRTQ